MRGTRSAHKATLEQVMAVPGVGAHIMASLTVPDRVRLRRTCRIFLSAADASLHNLTELFGDDASTQGHSRVPGRSHGLPWLLTKCPNLRTLSVASRASATSSSHVAYCTSAKDSSHETSPSGGAELGPSHSSTRTKCSSHGAATSAQCPSNEGACSMRATSSSHGVEQVPTCSRSRANSSSGMDILPWMERERRALMWPHPGFDWIARDALTLDEIATQCRLLHRLVLAGCKDVTDAGLVAVSRLCSELASLDVTGCDVGDVGVIAVAEASGGRLRGLTVSLCKGVTDASFRSLGRHCRRLEEVFAEGTGVSDGGIIALVGSNDHGDNAHHDGDAKDNDGEAVAHGNKTPIKLLSLKERGDFADGQGCGVCLRRLTVRGAKGVTDASIRRVADRCPNLEQLGVRECEGVTDASILCVAACCPRLVWLDAARCKRVSDESIVSLAASCSGLTHVSVRRTEVSDVGVSAIGRHCRGVACLDVGVCPRVTDAGIMEIAANCPRLRHLSVANCDKVTDAGIRQVAERCRDLQELNISKSGARDGSMRALAAHCRDLRYLDMAGCHVQGESLEALARECQRLEYLDVSTLACATEEIGGAITRHCTGLRVVRAQTCDLLDRHVRKLIQERGSQLWALDLYNTDVTNLTVKRVAQSCPRLIKLGLAFTAVTDDGLSVLEGSRCKRLWYLDVHGCRNVWSPSSLRALNGGWCRTFGQSFVHYDEWGTTYDMDGPCKW